MVDDDPAHDWTLRLYTYAGLLAHAHHYNAVIKEPWPHGSMKMGAGTKAGVDYPQSYRVEHAMTAEEAKVENEADPDFNWKAGELTERMFSKEIAIEEAEMLFLTLAKPGDRLIMEYGTVVATKEEA